MVNLISFVLVCEMNTIQCSVFNRWLFRMSKSDNTLTDHLELCCFKIGVFFFSFFGIGYDYAFRQFSIVWLTQILSSSFLWANKVSSKIGSCLHNPFKIKGEDKQCNARTFVFKQIMFLLHIFIDTYRKRRSERRTKTKIHVYCNEKAKNFNFQLHHKTNYLTTLTISNYNTIEMNPFNIMPAKSMWMS